MRTIISGRATAFALALLIPALWAAPSQAASQSFQVQLTGGQQVPAVQTNGMGTADLTYNPTSRRLTWSVSYSGLSGPVTMAHIHVGGSGTNGPVAVSLTKAGSAVANPIKGAARLTAAQAQQLKDGQLYINVHTMAHPSGEIRGQIMLPSG